MTGDGRNGERTTWAEYGVLLLLTLGLTLAVGVTNGEENHRQYLLEGLHRANSDYLAHDWFVTETEKLHPAFNALVELLARAQVLDLGLALGSLLAAGVFVLSLYWIAGALYDRPLLPTVGGAVLFSTLGPTLLATTYLLSPVFQPNVIGGVLFLLGVAGMARQRNLTAGAAFGVGGLFHAHYAALAVTMLAGVTAVRWRPWMRDPGGWSWRDALRIWGAFLLFASPSLVRVLMVGSGVHSPEATEAYLSRFGMHYLPQIWPSWEYFVFFAPLVVGIGGLLLRTPDEHEDLTAVASVIGALVFVSLPLGYWGGIDFVNRLWPWRLAPFLLLGAMLLISGALAKPLNRTTGDRPVRWRIGLGVLLCGLLLVSRTQHSGEWWPWLPVLGLPVFLALAGEMKQRLDMTSGARDAVIGVVLVLGLVPATVEGIRASHLETLQTDTDRAPLYEWARESTPRSSVFVVPPTPEWSDFRLRAARPVLVDWNVIPYAEDEFLTWKQRLEDILGGVYPGGDRVQARRAYRAVGCDTMELVASRYDVGYVVRYGANLDGCASVAYREDDYVVYRMGAG